MVVKNVNVRLWALVLVLALCVPTAWAQQKDTRVNPPIQPIGAGESSSKAPAESAGAPAAPAPSGDKRPLSGAQDFTASGGGGRSYLLPSIRLTQGLDSNNASQPGASSFGSQTTVHGSVALQHTTGNNQLAATYSTGGILYNNAGRRTSPVHNMSFSDVIGGRRWTLMLADNFSYLPESAFSLGGFGGVGGYGQLPGTSNGVSNGFPGGGINGNGNGNLNPQFIPNQTIMTAPATRVANSVVGQLQYTFNPRWSVTASGSYGFLRFLDPGFINSNNQSFHGGLNYTLSAYDSLAVTYSYSRFRFSGLAQGVDNQNFHLTYGRKISGRLALQAGGGPQVNKFRNPVSGAGTSVSWSMFSALRYTLPRGEMGLTYGRSMNSGSGVLLGSQGNTVEASLNRELSRLWAAGFTVGYARNSALQQLATGPAASLVFNGWRGGASLSRPWGRYANLFFSYNVNRQSSSGCQTPGCSTSTLRHHFSIGFSWQFRPISLD